MKLIIFRHGQTDANKIGCCNQLIDISLNINGILQAKALGKQLAKENIDVILSSPLKRAIQTSELICLNKKIDIISLNYLREVNTGDVTGMSYDDFYNKYITIFGEIEDTSHKDFLISSVPGGESRLDVYNRWNKVLNYIKTECISYKTIAIATHYGFMKAIYFYYNKEDKDEIDNCEFFCVNI